MATEGSTAKHRFGSYAPIRNGSQAKWFVDGEDYMAAVADSIEAAEKEIFITDWQLNPHIFMKRPDSGIDSLHWRLDKMLLRKAEQGVRTYILLYWESKTVAGMDLGSEYAQSVLSHENIEVLRHPDFSTVIFKPTSLRWSHHEKVVIVDRSIAFVGGIDLCFGRWDTHSHDLTDHFPPHPCVLENDECARIPEESTVQYSRWIGKDYGNTFLYGARANLNEPMKDYVDRSKDPRMPWHDVACSVSGSPALDVATHFIQRYKHVKPRCSFQDVLPNTELHQISNPSGSNLTIQVLRSVGKWSAGQPHEASIYNAYLQEIQNAEHFIYIENQFFISSQEGEVKNEIMSTLADRIYRAYQHREDFHAMVIIPLKPEFPEKWDTGRDLRIVSYWNYATIFRGKDSLMNRLESKGIPSEAIPRYFRVQGLRTHGSLNGNLVTEIVYVHSKLMIVDDRVAIIGSANINDRSMLGYRDSEVAVIIQDNDMMEGTMNGQPYQVGKFCHSLRCHLLKEHLGLLQEMNATPVNIKVEDPLTSAFHSAVSKLAKGNTCIFEKVFGGRILPTNNARNLDELKDWKSISGVADDHDSLEKAIKELEDIQGRIVLFPQLFLTEELKAYSSLTERLLDFLDVPKIVDTGDSTIELTERW